MSLKKVDAVTPEASPLLTHDEAANYLRMTPNALYGARHRGDAPPAFRRGRRLLYQESDLIAWVNAKVEAATAEAAAS